MNEEFDPDSPSAKISEITGDVSYQEREIPDWHEAEVNQHLFPAETIRTGQKSVAKLLYVDASRVTMAPETELVIKSIEPPSGEQGLMDIIIRVVIGLTMFEVKDAEGTREFMVESPSAITCVRGTIFSVEVDEKGTTRVVVKQGKVEVTGAGKVVEVISSYATVVSPGKAPSTPKIANLTQEDIFSDDLKKLPDKKRR